MLYFTFFYGQNCDKSKQILIHIALVPSETPTVKVGGNKMQVGDHENSVEAAKKAYHE